MGGSYFVPRSVKGESRILLIFSVKSFIASLIFGLIGVVLYLILKSVIGLALIPGLIIIAVFAAIGYGLTSIIIPDIPQMGALRKAGRREYRGYVNKIVYV